MPDNRDHRTDEPATRCTEPVEVPIFDDILHLLTGHTEFVKCDNLLPCMDHPQRRYEVMTRNRGAWHRDGVFNTHAEAESYVETLDRDKIQWQINRYVEQGEQNGEAGPEGGCACFDEHPHGSGGTECLCCDINALADLQRERDEYREALREIASSPPLPHPGMLMAKARDVLAKWSRKDGGR